MFEIGQKVMIAWDAPTSNSRAGWIWKVNAEKEEATIDFRDGTDLCDIVSFKYLKLTSDKSNFVSRGFLEMSLPYGKNRREIRDNFARSSGGTNQRVYDTDNRSKVPTVEDIEQLFAEMRDDEVLILLGSNAYSIENELLAYVVLNPAGWSYLLGPGMVYPKVLKRTFWNSVQSLAKKD